MFCFFDFNKNTRFCKYEYWLMWTLVVTPGVRNRVWYIHVETPSEFFKLSFIVSFYLFFRCRLNQDGGREPLQLQLFKWSSSAYHQWIHVVQTREGIPIPIGIVLLLSGGRNYRRHIYVLHWENNEQNEEDYALHFRRKSARSHRSQSLERHRRQSHADGSRIQCPRNYAVHHRNSWEWVRRLFQSSNSLIN